MSLLQWNAVFWDEHQHYPLYGLDTHLILLNRYNREMCEAAIEHISKTPQRWAVTKAQEGLDIQRLECCDTLECIRMIHSQLLTINFNYALNKIVNNFYHISKDVDSALKRKNYYILKQDLEAVIAKLNALFCNINADSGLSDSDTVIFLNITENWRKILGDYLSKQKKASESRQEIDSPYLPGEILQTKEHAEMFVGREDIIARIERLLRNRRCPPIFLYGQRRMGKSSLLYYMANRLPDRYIPMYVDVQELSSTASSHSEFFRRITTIITRSARKYRGLDLPSIDEKLIDIAPFVAFGEWLDNMEDRFGDEFVFFLMLDEFEGLEMAFSQHRLSKERILGIFRHIIQHRRYFRFLLSGAHPLEIFHEWHSYLINVKTECLSYLRRNEAQHLIENPVPDFVLRYTPEAVHRILALTRKHPALIHMLCDEIVELKNKQSINSRRLVQKQDVESSVPITLESGRFFFSHIGNYRSDEMDVLSFIAMQGEEIPVSRKILTKQFGHEYLDSILSKLMQYEIIEEFPEGYRFQVELIRRWFI